MLAFQRPDAKLAQAVAIVDGDGNQYGTATNPWQITFPDNAQVDAFGRLRVSEPALLLDMKRVGSTPEWNGTDSVSGTGSAVYSANRASTALTVGAGVGVAIRQSKARAVYQPGKSLQLLQTFILAPGETYLRQRCGYFDAKNGVFLEDADGIKSFVRRTYVGGSADDNAVTQDAWNLDTMDGNGPSGVTIDWTKPQILFADFEWLGVGRVRIGFVYDGAVIFAHQFLNTNRTLDAVYMSNCNLPVRWEIEATDTLAGTATLEAICASVSSEGGFQEYGFTASADSGTTANAIASGAMEELLAIRMQSAFTEFATAHPVNVNVINTTSGPFRWRLVLNPTETGAGTWAAVGGSIMEQNTTRTVTANTGTVIASGYVAAQANEVSLDVGALWKMGTTLAGVTDVLSLQIHNLSVQSEDFFGSIGWHATY